MKLGMSAQEAPEYSRRDWAVLCIVCAAIFMATLDMFVVNVALPAIGEAFTGSRLSELSWILNGYTIVYAAFLVPAGKLADRFGHAAGFRAGVALFTAGSLGCALSDSLPMLVGFRMLQAAGASLATPSGYALLMTVLPAAQKARSVRIWASVGAMSGVAGPVVGGILVDLSWRLIFVLNVPLGIATFLAALWLIPHLRPDPGQPMPDFAGAALLVAAVGALTLALVEGSNWGWMSPSVLGALALAVAAGLAFVWRARHARAPIVDLALVAEPVFARINIAILLTSVAFAGALLSVVLFVERVWDWSATAAGMAVAPGPLMVPLASLAGQRLRDRVEPGRLVAFGALLIAAGSAFFALAAGTEARYFTTMMPGWLLIGAGAGFAFPTAIAAATDRLAADRVSTASGFVTMGRQVGTALGAAVIVAVLASGGPGEAPLDLYRLGWWLLAALAATGMAAALIIPPRPTPERQNKAPERPLR